MKDVFNKIVFNLDFVVEVLDEIELASDRDGRYALEGFKENKVKMSQILDHLKKQFAPY
jgi:hypothetical protein